MNATSLKPWQRLAAAYACMETTEGQKTNNTEKFALAEVKASSCSYQFYVFTVNLSIHIMTTVESISSILSSDL